MSWPIARLEVPPNWMEPLLLHPGGVRTVAVHYEPVAPSRAQRHVDRQTVKLASDEAQRSRSVFGSGTTAGRNRKSLIVRPNSSPVRRVRVRRFRAESPPPISTNWIVRAATTNRRPPKPDSNSAGWTDATTSRSHAGYRSDAASRRDGSHEPARRSRCERCGSLDIARPPRICAPRIRSSPKLGSVRGACISGRTC